MESEGAMLEESARSEKLLEGAEHGGAGICARGTRGDALFLAPRESDGVPSTSSDLATPSMEPR